MNYENLTRRLINTTVDTCLVDVMDAFLPEFMTFGYSLDRLLNEVGGPAYEELFNEMVKIYTPIVKTELEKDDANE